MNSFKFTRKWSVLALCILLLSQTTFAGTATFVGGGASATGVIAGTGATNLGKAEDAAAASGDTGVAMMSVRRDTAASSAGTDGDYSTLNTDSTGNLWVREAFAPGYEDNTNNVAKVEQRFSFLNMSADTQVKASAGFIHTITFSQIDAAPTAGTIIVYDNTAESGTIIFSSTWTTAVFYPTTITIDASFATGLYIGFTTTADVGVTVSYR